MARPKKQISKEFFEKLCSIHCTLAEIAGFFDCSEDTIERWCKREYKENFADVYKKKSAQGNISLRRAQFKIAEKNATMAIWLGKQFLGQRDEMPIIIGTEQADDPITKALRAEAERINNERDKR